MADKGEAERILESFGIDEVCTWIEEGKSQSEIAENLGISPGAVSRWLNKPEHEERSARARTYSAESWLDRGLAPLKEALSKESGIDASAAKAYAQECARRAALRNPKYVERTAHELSGPGGKPIEHTHTVSAATRGLLEKLSGIGADSGPSPSVPD